MGQARSETSVTPKTRPAATLLLLLTAIPVVGCTRHHTVAKSTTGAPKYDRLEVVYDLQDGHGALSSSAIQPVEYVSEEAGAAIRTTTKAWSRATLRIESPHPEAKSGQARLTLRLARREATRPTTSEPSADKSVTDRVLAYVPWTESDGETGTVVEEVWVLDVPREEIDLLLVDLARTGYFEEGTRPNAAAHLDVQIDKGRESKAWHTSPRMDELAERVRSEGWIARMPAPEQAKPWWSF